MYDNTSDEGKDVLEEMFAELVVDDYGKAHASQLSPSQLKNSQEAFQLMTGKKTRTDIYIDEWLLGWDVKLQTRNQGRRYVEAMALKFPVVSMLTRKAVKAWYKELQEEKGITVKTFNGRLSPCKGYWSYLQDKGVVSEALNPFDGLGLRNKKIDIVRQPFTVLEIQKLFSHFKAQSNQDPKLFQLFTLAIYTGARIEELCSIKTEEVGDGYLAISNSKTAAGVRQVPIHPEIADAVAAMKMASEDGYLLSGLNGMGVAEDDKQAVYWYRKAAEQGNAIAQTNLGAAYDRGGGVVEDDKQAAQWYTKAAEQGNADAQNNLGVMYDIGDGVAEDDVKAHMWFNIAAADGQNNAKSNKKVIKQRMSPSQIEKAQEMARECVAKNYKGC
ncbi:hypothetical protein OAI46_06955 [Alphaproteobacteria bacterium]|nr:hypothetical protein [Alphaproteobacteria bacterium]